MLSPFPIKLFSLKDYPTCPAVEETGDTFLENALLKARTVAAFTGEWVLADDSGLEVDVLDGAPGVRSARFAGDGASDEENNRKLLAALNGIPEDRRGASFRCVIVLYNVRGKYEVFEGTWRGIIGTTPRGNNGFGYDPLFYVPELGLTAAELPSELKNRLSHRGQAMAQLIKYLHEMPFSV